MARPVAQTTARHPRLSQSRQLRSMDGQIAAPRPARLSWPGRACATQAATDPVGPQQDGRRLRFHNAGRAGQARLATAVWKEAMSEAGPIDRDALVAALGGRSIVLVGMMGAGKTSVGRRMAARLDLPFVDADAEIEAGAQMSVPEIFERFGES